MPNGPKELIVLSKLPNLFSGLGRILCKVPLIDNNNSFVPLSHLSLEDSELYSISLILNTTSESLDNLMISTVLLIFTLWNKWSTERLCDFFKVTQKSMLLLWKGAEPWQHPSLTSHSGQCIGCIIGPVGETKKNVIGVLKNEFHS